MAKDLPPMEPNGVWLQLPDGQGPATYVAHKAHITRLTLDGWHPVADPRPEIEAHKAVERETKVQQEREAAKALLTRENLLLEEIASLKAALANTGDATDDSRKQAKRKSE